MIRHRHRQIERELSNKLSDAHRRATNIAGGIDGIAGTEVEERRDVGTSQCKEGETVRREPATLAEFFQEFIRRHSKTGPESGWLVLDVTPEECEALGRSFVYIMAGWAAGLDMARSKERGILLPDWLKPVGIVDEEEEGLLNGKIN